MLLLPLLLAQVETATTTSVAPSPFSSASLRSSAPGDAAPPTEEELAKPVRASMRRKLSAGL